MSKLYLIGDIHGKTYDYNSLLLDIEENPNNHSIQVGDFGFYRQWAWASKNVGKNHYIIPGNHDQYPECINHERSCGNYSLFSLKFDFGQELTLMTIRGANSIDKQFRTPGIDWFPEEELNVSEQDDILEVYKTMKPSIVVSHDCPQSFRSTFFDIWEKSSTSVLLEDMFRYHQPMMWFFGHYHRNQIEFLNGTTFRCLDELSTSYISGITEFKKINQ